MAGFVVPTHSGTEVRYKIIEMFGVVETLRESLTRVITTLPRGMNRGARFSMQARCTN